MFPTLLLIVCCCYASIEAIDYNLPIQPKIWQQLAGTGFATNYFKTTNYRKYNPKNIQDVYDRGYRNLRLRCRTGLKDLQMDIFLDQLNRVVDRCLEVGVVPIISWINHQAEADGTDDQREEYVSWWRQVAAFLKDKDYRLAFNLFTELGVESKCGDDCVDLNTKKDEFVCPKDCNESLAENLDKYSNWTKHAVAAIRGAGGNNQNRILILGSPRKTGDALVDIPSQLYEDDDYMMAEWHIYASGPNKKMKNNGKASVKYWKGNGEKYGRANVHQALSYAEKWTAQTGVETYFGAWMPQDNDKGSITQKEAINFASYFVKALEPIPWSLNVLDNYYDTRSAVWLTGIKTIKGRKLNMKEILRAIEETRDDTGPNDESFAQDGRHTLFDILDGIDI